jgi:hypothetical protein
VQRAVDELGGLDILVNNAAFQMSLDEGIESLTTEQLERTYRTNVFAMVWLCKAAVRQMQPARRSSTSSSIQAYQPSPELLDYASTGRHRATSRRGSRRTSPRGDPRQHRRTGPDLDAVDPGDHAGGEDRVVRAADAARPGWVSRPSWRPPSCSSPRRSRATSPGERIGVTGGQPLP